MRDMFGSMRIATWQDLWRSVCTRLAYLLIGSVLGVIYAALPIMLAAFEVTSVVAWSFSYFVIALMVYVSGSSHWLRDLDRRITNTILGTAVPAPKRGVVIGNSTHPLWRKIIGLTSGCPAWRGTFWFAWRSLFGLLTLAMVGIAFGLPLAVLPRFLENNTLDTFGAFLSAVWGIMLGLTAILVLLLVVGAWTYLPAGFFSTSVSQLLGPSSDNRIAELRQRLHEFTQHDHLGRALHDTVGRTLTGILMQASAARRQIYTEPERAHQMLSDIETAAREAHGQLNAALNGREERADMKPVSRRDLERFLRLVREYGLPVSADISARFDELSDIFRQEVYSTVEEGCLNVYRHAAGAHTNVCVAISEVGLEVTIINEPPPSNLSSGLTGGCRGLRDLCQRVEALDGSFEAGPQEEGGFLLRTHIPSPLIKE